MAERCYYLDLTKVIATFLVIFGHLYSADSAVRLYLYAFHMPLFFIISGVFHKNKGRVDWQRYAKALLWPAFIFILFFLLSDCLLGKSFHDAVKTYFIDLPKGRYLGILWFLFALFWCKVFTDLFILANKPVLSVILWGAGLFISVLFNKRLPFEMTQGLMAFPFYIFGYFCRSVVLNRTPHIKYLPIFLTCLVLSTLITIFHGRVSIMGLRFGQLPEHLGINLSEVGRITKLLLLASDVVLFYLNGVIGSIMVLSLALLPIPECPSVTKIAYSLITVVGTQKLFINPIEHFWGLDQSVWINVPLAICIYVLCYYLHRVLSPVYRLDIKYHSTAK